MTTRSLLALLLGATPLTLLAQSPAAAHPARRNVIVFVADGLRRGSVNPTDTPTLFRLRSEGVDLRNSHSVYPTVTTANASAIATGHALGDTGDFANDVYPGFYLTDPAAPAASDSISPFLENDSVLASMNAAFDGNYFGEPTLLSAAHDAGYNVAAVGKLGPTAIQLLPLVHRNPLGQLDIPDAIILDDATGSSAGIPLPLAFADQLRSSPLATRAPLRTNGYAPDSQWSNSFAGDASTPGTLAANLVQERWFADVSTQLILPDFARSPKPFVLLFWSRDPDGTQHDEGDSLQTLTPGINGNTVTLALRNADHCLAQLLDWLHQHPAIEANTDILVTSDHGFATITRRELDAHGATASTPAAALTYTPLGPDKPEPPHTLPQGFLAIDLALATHQRLFDPDFRSDKGDSVYQEVTLSGETARYPLSGNALLGPHIKHLDGSDARLIVTTNGGSDLLYVPSHDPDIVHQTLAALSSLDYLSGIFVDDAFCPTPAACPGALPLSAVGLKGSTHLPTPAIVVSFRGFYLTPGDLLSGIQLADTNLQEGQGNHGALLRDQTWNNMAALGPDFKQHFVDPLPVGNIDITPTLASLLGLHLDSRGQLHGRVLTEALRGSPTPTPAPPQTLLSAPTDSGRRTVLHFQSHQGVRYFDRSCILSTPATTCPE